MPLPKLWYFPNFDKTILVMTADQDAATAAQINQELADIHAHGGNASVYLINYDSSQADVANWISQGTDVGFHIILPRPQITPI